MSTIKETKSETSKPQNIILWLLIAVLITAGVWANYHYQTTDISVRLIGWIVLVIILLLIARLTAQGKRAWLFAKDARGELRKVVWPTRHETIQTTLIVLGLVIVLALIIWGLDSFLLWAIGLLTGQRGL